MPIFDRGEIFAPARNNPIIESLLDLDVYKLVMGQFINSRDLWKNTIVTFSLIVRTKGLDLSKVIDETELREQLNHARSLKATAAELAYLRGMPLGNGLLFTPEYINFWKHFQLPEYDLKKVEGGYELTFTGPWGLVTYWETIAMSTISELYYWSLVKNHKIKDYQFAGMYGGLFYRLQEFKKIVERVPGLTFSEFATRRRHSRQYQEQGVRYLLEAMPNHFSGTSNVYLAMRLGSENPIGTNAHELPMVVANLTQFDTDEEIRWSQYRVVLDWFEMYPQLAIILPDTFGTTQFLKGAPKELAQKSTGVRLDSKDPDVASDEVIKWWQDNGADPQTKLLIPSDGLTAQKMVDLYQKHGKRVHKYTFGIGTNLMNNCDGLWPLASEVGFGQFSMVVKITKAGGKPAVKLSDNPGKALGGARAERFKGIFGVEGHQASELHV